MIKKIARITLSILALIGISASIIFAAANYSQNFLLKTIAISGLGITMPVLSPAYITHNNDRPPPNTYINLPIDPNRPTAVSLYDSFLSADDPTGGQDPQPDPPPDVENNPPSIPEGAFPVIALDMSENQTVNNLKYKNESKYSPDINSLATANYPVVLSQTVSADPTFQPTVLIIHTHGTECYLPDGTNYYTSDTPTRTANTDHNVVAVGKVFAEELTKKGVSVIHCETMFDAESYSKSYGSSTKRSWLWIC